MTFLFCEIRKYFGDHVSLIREAFRDCAPKIRALVATKAKRIPSWVIDKDLQIELLTGPGSDSEEVGEPED